MLYNQNCLETKQRLTDFWKNKYIGRPIAAIHTPDPKAYIKRPEPPLFDEDRYLNPEWHLKNLEYRFSNTVYIGEAIPSDSVLATPFLMVQRSFSVQEQWLKFS